MYIAIRVLRLFFILTIFFGYGQVGINTKAPNATLDIQGDLGVRKKYIWEEMIRLRAH